MRAVVLCEGEIDCMSYAQYGISALSVPFGGGKGAKQQWIEFEYHNLDRFEEIFISMDVDDVGREAARKSQADSVNIVAVLLLCRTKTSTNA